METRHPPLGGQRAICGLRTDRDPGTPGGEESGPSRRRGRTGAVDRGTVCGKSGAPVWEPGLSPGACSGSRLVYAPAGSAWSTRDSPSLCPARRPTRGSWPLVATSLAQRWASGRHSSPCSPPPCGPLRRMGSEALRLGGDRAEPRSYAYFAPFDNLNASWPWMPAGYRAAHGQRPLVCAGLRRALLHLARTHLSGPARRGDAGSDWSGTVNRATQPTLQKSKGRPPKWDCP